MNKKRIYIAGPLTAIGPEYLKNISNMMTAGEHIRKLGYSVYIPGLDLLMGIKFGYTSINEYFDNSIAWLKVSDALYLCEGWQNSAGTLKEIEIAEAIGIPIFIDSGELDQYLKVFTELEKALLLGYEL